MIRKILRLVVDIAFLPLSIPLNWALRALRFEAELTKLAQKKSAEDGWFVSVPFDTPAVGHDVAVDCVLSFGEEEPNGHKSD